MNTTEASASELVRDVTAATVDCASQVDVGVAPPFVWLAPVRSLIAGTHLQLAAQNLHWEDAGAFTGEVSGPMLRAVGAQWVIVGHSERRQFFGETDDAVSRKAAAAIRGGVGAIVCLGETAADRDNGQALAVVDRQLSAATATLAGAAANQLCIAYEPVWAIGTGKTATPALAQEVHGFIRKSLRQRLGSVVADAVRLLYGGSVKADNAASLFAENDIDGALVGGASLRASDFAGIVNAAARSLPRR